MENEEEMECPTCEGTGWIDRSDAQDEYQCPDCKGSGYLTREDVERINKNKAEWARIKFEVKQ